MRFTPLPVILAIALVLTGCSTDDDPASSGPPIGPVAPSASAPETDDPDAEPSDPSELTSPLASAPTRLPTCNVISSAMGSFIPPTHFYDAATSDAQDDPEIEIERTCAYIGADGSIIRVTASVIEIPADEMQFYEAAATAIPYPAANDRGLIVLGVREQQGLDSQLEGALLIFDEWVTVAIGAQDAEGNQIVGGIAVQAAADAAIAVHDVIRR